MTHTIGTMPRLVCLSPYRRALWHVRLWLLANGIGWGTGEATDRNWISRMGVAAAAALAVVVVCEVNAPQFQRQAAPVQSEQQAAIVAAVATTRGTPKAPNRKGGFTLIELSIALVIIGLIIGGIFVGKDMIHAAEIRSMIGNVEKYTTAVNTFKTKFNEIPGDMVDATAMWGTNPQCAGWWGDMWLLWPNPVATAPQTVTCNGNGNGQIDMYESFLFWQHLANANLIAGAYSGEPSPIAGLNMKPGLNVPAIPFNSQAGLLPFYLGSTLNYTWLFIGVDNFPGNYGNAFILTNACYGPVWSGADETSNGYWCEAISAADAMSIDQKIDDGLPGGGAVRGDAYSGCSTSTNAALATYKTTTSGAICTVFFMNKF
jgi:prepilin-type N-terminal cleavage/methylation domain-containing protein